MRGRGRILGLLEGGADVISRAEGWKGNGRREAVLDPVERETRSASRRAAVALLLSYPYPNLQSEMSNFPPGALRNSFTGDLLEGMHGLVRPGPPKRSFAR